MFLYIILIIQSICEFLPISSSTIIELFAKMNSISISSLYMGIVHGFTGFVGISFYYKELCNILTNRRKLFFYLLFCFGFSLGFFLLFLAKGPGLFDIHRPINSFSFIKHILQGLVLYYMLVTKTEDEDPSSWKYYGLGFFSGFMVWISYLSGTSRLTGLLLVLRFIMSIEDSFKHSVILSSLINIFYFFFCVNKSPVASLTIIQDNIMGLPLVFIFGLSTLYVMNRNVKYGLIISNYIRIFIYGALLIKNINIMEYITNLMLKLVPYQYIKWIYGFLGGLIGNSIIILLAFKHDNGFANIFSLIFLICGTSFIIDLFIIKFMHAFYYDKIHKILNNQSIQHFAHSKIMVSIAVILYRFIPFSRLIVMSFALENFSYKYINFLNMIGLLIWGITIYFVVISGLFTKFI
jgi:hypothetical protein